MLFTAEDYQQAIEYLKEGLTQLVPNGNCCHICHDGCYAGECGFNPLVAQAICVGIARHAEQLHQQLHDNQLEDIEETFHEFLHYLSGYNMHMGMQVGPAKVVPPQSISFKREG